MEVAIRKQKHDIVKYLLNNMSIPVSSAIHMIPFVCKKKDLKMLQILYSSHYTASWTLLRARAVITIVLEEQWSEGASEVLNSFTTEVVYASSLSCQAIISEVQNLLGSSNKSFTMVKLAESPLFALPLIYAILDPFMQEGVTKSQICSAVRKAMETLSIYNWVTFKYHGDTE